MQNKVLHKLNEQLKNRFKKKEKRANHWAQRQRRERQKERGVGRERDSFGSKRGPQTETGKRKTDTE